MFGITGGALIVNALVISGKINLDPWLEIIFGVLASIIGAIIIYFCASREDLKISTLAIIGFSLGAMCVAISTGIMAYSRVFTQQALSVIGGSTANLNWDFFDSDKEIEKQNNISIKKIFKLYGENYFRKKDI